MARYQLIAVLFLSMMGFAQEFSPTVPQDKTCTGTDVFTAYVAGKFTCTTFAGGGITTLDTLSGATQTFSKTDDTNVTLTLTPAAADHNFALGWTGTLAKGRTLGTTVYTDQANTWSTGAQEIDGTTAAESLIVANTAAATSSGSTNSPRLIVKAAYWNGSASADDKWIIGSLGGTGTNGTAILSISHSGGSGVATIRFGNFVNTLGGYQVNGSSLNFSNLAGSVSAAQLPNPTASTLGGVESLAAAASKWINTISTSGVPSATQPAFSDISGTASTAQIPSLAAAKITSGQIALAQGGTNADLSGTGGTSQVLKQVSVGAAVTVGQLAFSDISSSVAASQMPALTGECTTSAGAVSVTCGSAIAHIVASGTSTFTTTAVASGACQTTVTTAATGAVASTDTMSWNYTTAPTAATDGRLTIQMWITTDNVNFMRCNNTAASVTPTALVARWKVLR